MGASFIARHAMVSPFAARSTAAASTPLEDEALLCDLIACPDLQATINTLLRALMKHTGAEHAALAWWVDQHAEPALQLVADGQGLVHPDPGAQQKTSTLAAAMEEAIDQGVTLHLGPGPAQPRDWVTLAHRLHLQSHASPGAQRGSGDSIVTTPLPGAQAPLGAITLQWRNPPDASAINWLENVASRTAPWLALQRQALRPWHWHARQAFTHWHQAVRQGTGRRKLWGAASLAVVVLALVPLPDQVGASARIEGAQQRVLVAPTDGFIKATHAHPGDKVKAGQVLADLAEQDLKLERDKWQSQVAQQDNAYAGAMTRADRAEAALSLSRLEEAQAQMALIDEQLQRSQLRAPFDGILIQGDLSQSIGAPVKQGDAVMTVASTQRFRVVMDVEEQDIARIQIGQTGELKLSALPWDTVSLKVQRITPLAQAKDGRQVFEVQADFTQALPDGLRPGLMGHAKVQTGWRPVLWTWVRPLLDRLAMAAWSWLG